MLKTKRVYERAESSDGARFLVDRLWPRGIKKEELKMKDRLKDTSKDVAPSPNLRKWFAHDPARWQEFQQRYLPELEANPDARELIVEAVKRGENAVCILRSTGDIRYGYQS